jgi:hypothetical protein
MQLLTIVLALYGALLSTFVAALNLRRGAPSLRVRAYPGYWTGDDPARAPGTYAVVELANERQVPVQAKSVGVMYPQGPVPIWEKIRKTARYRRHWRTTCWVHSYAVHKEAGELPAVVEPAHSVQIWIPDAALAAALRDDGASICIFYVQDGLGRTFHSNLFRVHR